MLQADRPVSGPSRADVCGGVARDIEDALDVVSNLAELRREAREGIAVADLVGGADPQAFLEDIETAADLRLHRQGPRSRQAPAGSGLGRRPPEG